MYRLLIVDNEAIIVESMLDLFNKNPELELEVYDACSSTEALRLLESTKIDIVLSDIRMPGMNGLELHREIISRWPWCKVIYLSGYNDFELIQEVIRNGGVDYLLKTEGDQAIIQAVQKAIQALSRTLEMDDLILKSKKQMKLIQPYLQKEYLWDFIQGDPHSFHIMDKQFRELNIPLNPALPVVAVIGRVDNWKDGASSFDKSLYLFSIQNIAEEFLAMSARIVSVVFDKTKILWLIQWIDEPNPLQAINLDKVQQRTLSFVKGSFEIIQHTCKELLKLKLSLAVGGAFKEWCKVPEQFDHLLVLLSRGLGLGEELLLLEQSLTDSSNIQYDHELRTQLKKINLLQTFLEGGEKQQFFNLYSTYMKLAAIPSSQTYSFKMEIYYTLISIFLSYINRWGLQNEIGDKIDLSKMTKLNHGQKWQEVIEYFHDFAEVLFEHKWSGQQYQEKDVIRYVQRYVEQNLAGDLSLAKIGEIVGHNPSYLSRLYKQVTNEGLSDYIVGARLSKVKELLQENQLKIQDISRAVGFLSEQSFYRFFRRATNLTPQEYRDLVEKCEFKVKNGE